MTTATKEAHDVVALLSRNTSGSEMALIPTGRFKIDPAYQRPLNEKRVAAMAAEWSDLKADAITVSARANGLYVIDGQHRLAAARLAGAPYLNALVHSGLSPAEEARLFVDLNTLAKKPNSYAIFRSELEAGDYLATNVVSIATSVGVRIDLNGSGKRESAADTTLAVATLKAIFQGSPTLLYTTLSVLRRALPDDKNALDQLPLMAVSSFVYTYREHPAYREDRLVEKLGERSAASLTRRARDLSSGSVTSGVANSNGLRMSFNKPGPRSAALEAYNRHLRNQLPPATIGDFRAIAFGRNPWKPEA